MKTATKVLGLAVLLAGIPIAAGAQAQISINIGFPEPPPLVVVSPGVQVVPEYDEEVFFVNSWYWVRRDGYWYRTRDWHGGWAPVRRGWVPANLVRMPPGQYRRYYRDDDGRWRPHRQDEFRDWRERNRPEERRAYWREHRNDEGLRREQERSWRDRRGPDRDRPGVEMQHQRYEQERMRRPAERGDRERQQRFQGPERAPPREDHGRDRNREHDHR